MVNTKAISSKEEKEEENKNTTAQYSFRKKILDIIVTSFIYISVIFEE